MFSLTQIHYFYAMINYSEPLFRPPSEAYSLILQITNGCSWNRCTFCEMYTSKKFSLKKEEEVLREIEYASKVAADTRKIFLADGDAMVLSTAKLLKILQALKNSFPRLNRVSAYASPGNLRAKSINELQELKEAGLTLIYVGIESGDDVVLQRISKGETYATTAEGLLKAHAAGIKSSVMILLGMGGKELSLQHARNSAAILNETQPHFASTLVLSFPFGEEHFQKRIGIPFELPDTPGLLTELRELLLHCKLKETIFRSDHASNYLSLKGILNRDQELLISTIDEALNHPSMLRKEWMRGL
ncbi:MAG: radical SAM protein [Bacteroidota bacterium]